MMSKSLYWQRRLSAVLRQSTGKIKKIMRDYKIIFVKHVCQFEAPNGKQPAMSSNNFFNLLQGLQSPPTNFL